MIKQYRELPSTPSTPHQTTHRTREADQQPAQFYIIYNNEQRNRSWPSKPAWNLPKNRSSTLTNQEQDLRSQLIENAASLKQIVAEQPASPYHQSNPEQRNSKLSSHLLHTKGSPSNREKIPSQLPISLRQLIAKPAPRHASSVTMAHQTPPHHHHPHHPDTHPSDYSP